MSTASRRRFLVMVFSLLVMAVASIPSFAGLQWCPGGDPSFLINGQYAVQANPMVAGVNMADVQKAGGVTLNVQVAPGTDVAVTKNVGPYTTAINITTDSSIPAGVVRFTMTVSNSNTTYPVALKVMGGQNPTTVYGASNARMEYNLVVY